MSLCKQLRIDPPSSKNWSSSWETNNSWCSQEMPRLCVNRRLITALSRSYHWFLPCAR